MKFVFAATAFAIALAAPAFADDQQTANDRCVALATKQIEGSSQGMNDDQKKMMSSMVADVCGCMTKKVGGLGDDGTKVLHVMATQSDADVSETDPAKQKASAVAILVKDYGMSEADAGALYDRVNPQVEGVATQCQQEAMSKMQPPAK